MCSTSTAFLDAANAAGLIPDRATVAITGSGGGLLEADAVFDRIEARFLTEGRPHGLTLVHALGVGDNERRGTNRFAHQGLVSRVIGGHWAWSPTMQRLAYDDRVEAYTLPAGVISLLLREIGARRPGLFTRLGLGTFADPRHGGGRCNSAAVEQIVELVELDGVEHLRYRPFQVQVGIIRGSTVDSDGNLSCAGEPASLDALAVAQAAKASGGLVIAQAKQRDETPLDPRRVTVPALLVDAVVLDPTQWQTYAGEYDGTFCGDQPAAELPTQPATQPATDAPAPRSNPLPRRLIAGRAAQEVCTGDVLNVGFGVSSEVVDALVARDRLHEVELCIEQGAIGGTPMSGELFGVSRGPRALLPSTTQFDLFAGGVLDRCFLSFAEVAEDGSVNVSKMGDRLIGPGGFVDISQQSDHVVFCGSFTAKGPQVELDGDELYIRTEGAVPKFVRTPQHLTYSGPVARQEGRRVRYVTERAVFELTADGLELIEVAHGVSIDGDIVGQMGFTPIVREPRRVDPRAWLAEATTSVTEGTS